MAKPLDSCRVLEAAFYLPAPLAGLILSDMGADVVKVEYPPSGDPLRILGGDFSIGGGRAFHSFNRGKRSCMLDLKEEEGREAFMRLAAKADVLLVSMRPSTIAQLGMDFESIEKMNPRIIYCSITGYGMAGPCAERAGHDLNYQAAAGILHLARDEKGRVVFPPVPLADIFGSFHAVVGILSALIERGRTGRGKCLDISMTESAFSPNLFNLSLTDIPGESYEARGMMLSGRYAFYNVYESSDGKWFALAAIESKFWRRFCEVTGREDLAGRQFDIGAVEVLSDLFRGKDSGYWMKVSLEEDVCLEPVLDHEGVLMHPQHIFRKALAVDSDEVLIPGFFPYDPHGKSLRAPLPGEHTREVLEEWCGPVAK